MNKRIIIASIVIVVNLLVLACGQSGNAWEPTADIYTLIEPTEAVETIPTAEPDIVLPIEPAQTEAPLPVVSAVADSATSESDPLESNQGTRTYSSQAVSFDCICQEAGTVTSNFVFSGDTVSDGGNVYQKTGQNTYTRSWIGQSILVVDGKETILDIPKHAVLIFSKHGYILENYSDADPSSGAPCCFYEFTLQK